MNDKNGVKGRIIATLRVNPDGMTILDISKKVGMSRHAVTKYIYQLLGEKKISQRQIGSAKVCYLEKGKK
ncbi:MAG: winged helix-turn-helix transcriptional regulator [Candidatus Aenigmatarchaeota archaeon]